MTASLKFVRAFFILLSSLLLTLYTTTMTDGLTSTNLLMGLAAGLSFGTLLIGLGRVMERFDLRTFNITSLGLLFGFIMGQAVMLLVTSAFDLQLFVWPAALRTLLSVCVYLTTAYLGLIVTARAAEELTMSIPFIRFRPQSEKKRDVLVDVSVLADPRMIDLAASGILDNHLVVARFLLKELYGMIESQDDASRVKARRCLDVLKKLEDNEQLNLRFAENDFPEAKDLMSKLVRLARLNDSSVLTADINRIQQASIEGIRIINIHSLANALKPITQTGEMLHIKIQRYGKEPRQGVGYLEDGTMVVVNGGAEYIGEVIEAHVLSVKHTSSGRMIFCNAPDEETDGNRTLEHNYASV